MYWFILNFWDEFLNKIWIFWFFCILYLVEVGGIGIYFIFVFNYGGVVFFIVGVFKWYIY